MNHITNSPTAFEKNKVGTNKFLESVGTVTTVQKRNLQFVYNIQIKLPSSHKFTDVKKSSCGIVSPTELSNRIKELEATDIALIPNASISMTLAIILMTSLLIKH
ncbi:MAG: hypothetical protein CXT78_10425 [Thaumarchaeota archaeon]|jgi:hypothetical protein|nr:MAG: hypothetical protein CXT78_10425 [Nitrososphaerota archaeon]